jgi:uncharacterized protein (TIGR01777 family)
MALPKRIVLTGASGFVGRALGAALAARGDAVIAVTRHGDAAKAGVPFAAEVASWEGLPALRHVDALVHLAGEPVAQRWTAAAKDRIVSSRLEGARLLLEAATRFEGRRPEVLVSASGIGYYGDRGDEPLDEGSSPGTGFLAQTCVAWERAAQDGPPVVPRVAIHRLGMVLGKGGGALAKMAPPFRLGLGGRIGSGRQWVSWVHLDDLVAQLLGSIDDPSRKGVYNAVAPEPVRNAEFTEALARALGRRARFPVPAPALRLAFGEMAGMLLEGQRVAPGRLAAEGFVFRYPRVFEALRACL